jgi:hypothetical protein
MARPTSKTFPVGPFKFEVTPRVLPQQLATQLPNGKVPALHLGYYDIVLQNAKGQPLARLAVADDGWPTLAPEDKQPAGALATSIRQGDDEKTYFDFAPRAGGAALLRLEASESGGKDTLTLESTDGEPHELRYPHAVLRVLLPGMFVSDADAAAAEREHDGEQRTPPP